MKKYFFFLRNKILLKNILTIELNSFGNHVFKKYTEYCNRNSTQVWYPIK